MFADVLVAFLSRYEQDWLDDEFDRSKWLLQNATAATTWMTQMNNGCAHSNVTIQMCMSHVRHIMQSIAMPQVTNARASGDYHPGNGQWNIGTTSMLAHALGIGPSKDNYWSVPEQPGTHYGPGVCVMMTSVVAPSAFASTRERILFRYTHLLCLDAWVLATKEPWPEMQSAVLSFSTGPVAPSDKVGRSNASIIMHACDSSGRLLSPDRPAANIDAHYVHLSGLAPGADGEIWVTYANVSGVRYSYVLTPEVSSAYNLSLAELGYDPSVSLAAQRRGSGALETVSTSKPLALAKCQLDSFGLVVLSPELGTSGWRLLGEPEKWVAVSPQRFSQVSADGSGVSATLSGGPGEVVTVRFQNSAGKVIQGSCTLSAAGKASIKAATDVTCSS